MIRKVLFGFIWFVAFYFLAGIVAGGVGSVTYAIQHPEIKHLSHQATYELGRQVGRQTLRRFYPLIVGSAVTLSIAGSAFGVLPGTRSRRPHDDWYADESDMQRGVRW